MRKKNLEALLFNELKTTLNEFSESTSNSYGLNNVKNFGYFSVCNNVRNTIGAVRTVCRHQDYTISFLFSIRIDLKKIPKSWLCLTLHTLIYEKV